MGFTSKQKQIICGSLAVSVFAVSYCVTKKIQCIEAELKELKKSIDPKATPPPPTPKTCPIVRNQFPSTPYNVAFNTPNTPGFFIEEIVEDIDPTIIKASTGPSASSTGPSASSTGPSAPTTPKNSKNSKTQTQ